MATKTPLQPANGTRSATDTVQLVQQIGSGGDVSSGGNAVTTGGTSASKTISAATTNATVVKATPGQVYGWSVNNVNAAVRYLKLYNKATAPTVGTDVPVLVIPIPATGVAAMSVTPGIAFSAGIGFALTSGIADADTGAVSADEHVVNILFK